MGPLLKNRNHQNKFLQSTSERHSNTGSCFFRPLAAEQTGRQAAFQLENLMSYKTILVHLQLGYPHSGMMHYACNLAERLDASLSAVAARHSVESVIVNGYASDESVAEELNKIQKDLAPAEHSSEGELRLHVPSIKLQRLGDPLSITQFVAEEARGADLILTNSDPSLLFEGRNELRLGNLLMLAGRPLLIAPALPLPLRFQHALIAWDDSRGCRRAVIDALCLLQKYADVTVVQLTERNDEAMIKAQLDDVVTWLRTHRINAKCLVMHDSGDFTQLSQVAEDHACDVIVAGAYGHSRRHELCFGGVTRSLLAQRSVSIMLAH